MEYKFKGKKFDEFEVGDEFRTASRTISEGDVSTFAGLSGDFNPLHTDEEYGKHTPFGGRIAHGLLAVAVSTGQANQLGIFEGTTIALLGMSFKYTGAVKFGDTIHTILTVAEKKESKKPDRGVITFDVKTVNQADESVVEGQWIVMLQREVEK
ncbi:MAG: MaoC family dehydratase N-terminal domain-containing protein [Thermoplasmata archaeon]|nr:MaoC family dehydratase N-terminal domain-containing protein [Thermoplasmata archaeon]